MVQQLPEFCVAGNFSYLSYDQFGAVCTASASIFADHIFPNGNSAMYFLYDVAYSADAETSFTSRWLMGSTNSHCLFESSDYYSSGHFYIAPIEAIIEEVKHELVDSKILLIKIINNSSAFNSLLRRNLVTVVEIAYGECPAATFMKLYFDFFSGYNGNGSVQLPLDGDLARTIPFSRWLAVNFERRGAAGRNNVLRAACSVSLNRYDARLQFAKLFLKNIWHRKT